jgi:hypothetical protein
VATTFNKKFGAIVMLDALGARSLTLDGAEGFVSSRNIFIETLQSELTTMHAWAEIIDDDMRNRKPIITTFGDTVLLSWELPEEKPERHLPRLIESLVPAVFVGLEIGFVFRGALSVGHYIQDQSTLVGPAIADAASWYERANWLGIIATPACGHRLSLILEEQFKSTRDSVSEWMVEYGVPLSRAGEIRRLWTISWPSTYLIRHTKPRARLFRQLSKYPVPLNTEDKYSNTVNFFDWFEAEIGPRLAEKSKQRAR